MSKPRSKVRLVFERLIHTAEALGLSSDPEQRAAAERAKKQLEKQLAKEDPLAKAA